MVIVAKAIRNSELREQDKKDIATFMAKELFNVDQFFDKKRFLHIAIQTFPVGWPNRQDDK